MPNKHIIKKDFDTKMKEWKEVLKVDVNQSIESEENKTKIIQSARHYRGER